MYAIICQYIVCLLLLLKNLLALRRKVGNIHVAYPQCGETYVKLFKNTVKIITIIEIY